MEKKISQVDLVFTMVKIYKDRSQVKKLTEPQLAELGTILLWEQYYKGLFERLDKLKRLRKPESIKKQNIIIKNYKWLNRPRKEINWNLFPKCLEHPEIKKIIVGRDANRQNLLKTLPIEQQKRLRGLPIALK